MPFKDPQKRKQYHKDRRERQKKERVEGVKAPPGGNPGNPVNPTGDPLPPVPPDFGIRTIAERTALQLCRQGLAQLVSCRRLVSKPWKSPTSLTG